MRRPPADCGDDVCDPEAESCLTCPADCGVCCGDGACTDNHGENCASCAADCACPDGEQCDPNAFRCVEACQPQCAGRACGDDGCGGVCGACGDVEFCDDGACAPVPAQCGDDACEDGETCENCPADCGICCGDGACTPGQGENCATCLADCGCENDERCDQASRMCVPACVPDCTNLRCGDNGCGGSCGMCNGEQVCVEGACEDPPADCGDDRCEDGENCANCPADCGICCGDGNCDDGVGENCATCLADCACPGDEQCDAEQRLCVDVCVPQCGGLVCGPNGCGGNCGLCANGFECNDGRCDEICVPQCGGKDCGGDGCGGDCGDCEEGEVCSPAGQCLGVGEGCDCDDDEVCLDGFCRAPDDLCDAENPVGLCPIGQACLDGECVDRGAGCSPGNPAGVCPRGELCRNGACEALDESALCDDDNACTIDRFDPQRNRCVHLPQPGGQCDDGNACTNDMCDADGQCIATPIGNCLAPPEIGPYVTPTNEGDLTLTGTKPAGSSIQINDQVAVPDNPEEEWAVEINLVPGENVFEIASVDRGQASESITVRIVYDIEAPVVEVSPCGGIYRDGVTVTAAGNEAADVYFTTDGGTPTAFDSTFFGAQAFRVFEDTSLRFIARDRAGNWSEAETRCDFEVTGYANRWNQGSELMETLSLAAVTSDGNGSLYVVGGTDGDAAQAGVMRYVPADDAWSNLASLEVDRSEASAVYFGGQIYVFGGRNEDIPLNFTQRLNPDGMNMWENRRAMPTTRFGLGTEVVGDAVYAFGGKTNGGVVLDTAERYTPGNDTWTNEIAQLPRPRYAFATAVVNNEIWLIGGEDEEGNAIAVVDVYNPGEDTWRQVADLPTPRSFLSADVMVNVGRVSGGYTGIVVAGGRLPGGAPTPVVEEFLIEREVWRTRTPMPAPRLGHGGAVLQGTGGVDNLQTQLWIVGGQVRDALTTNLTYYTYELDYTTRLTELPEGRFMHAAVPWAGRIYLFGGRKLRRGDRGLGL